jgi:2-succinyl-6-hydroxy-2,4-cyclohexadiene-1-carboxylate synthase
MAPPTIVLLHGFTQTGRSWAPTIAALGERYRALAPDLRGHGDNAAARPVDFDAIAADVLAQVPPPEPFALAGYSMGGRIALRLALSEDAKDRITRLTLVGASPGLRSDGERAARRAEDETLARELERDGIKRFARRWAAQPLFAGQSPDVAAAAQAERLRNDPAGLAAALRGVGTGAMPSLWDRLHELTMPVSLIVGERDLKFARVADQMARAIPDASLHVVAGAGHAVQLEAPEAVAALL